jgi:hypothetical protein
MAKDNKSVKRDKQARWQAHSAAKSAARKKPTTGRPHWRPKENNPRKTESPIDGVNFLYPAGENSAYSNWTKVHEQLQHYLLRGETGRCVGNFEKRVRKIPRIDPGISRQLKKRKSSRYSPA